MGWRANGSARTESAQRTANGVCVLCAVLEASVKHTRAGKWSTVCLNGALRMRTDCGSSRRGIGRMRAPGPPRSLSLYLLHVMFGVNGGRIEGGGAASAYRTMRWTRVQFWGGKWVALWCGLHVMFAMVWGERVAPEAVGHQAVAN